MFPRRIFSQLRRLHPGSTTHRCVTSSAPKQWKEFDEKDVKNHVANIFLCSQREADALVDSVKDEFSRDRCGRIEILRQLRKKGFNIEDVSSCKVVMNLPYESFHQRIQFCSQVLEDSNASSIISVLRLSDKDYYLLKKLLLTNHPKLKELSDLFKLSKLETSQLLLKYRFLIRSRVSTLREKIGLLQEKGMTVEVIRKDLWVLTYTRSRLLQRFDEIQKMNINPTKPWMLRCLPEVLVRTYHYRHENQAALAPYPTFEAFFADRLGMSEDQVRSMARKYPHVMRIQVTKIKEMIDYLISEGYSAAKISRTPRILCHSLATIQSRMDELKRRNYTPKGLSVLCKSSRCFEDFISKVDRFKEAEKQS